MATAQLIKADSKSLVTGVRTSEELLRLGPEWQELFRRIRCDNVFLSYEWASEWWHHFGCQNRLFIVTVRDELGTLIAVAPLYIVAQAPLRLRRLGFLGDNSVASDYLDFLMARIDVSTCVEQICRFVLRQQAEWDYIELSDHRGDSIVATSFRELMEDQGLTAAMAVSSACPYVILPNTPEEYLKSLGRRLRHNLKYSRGALLRAGAVDLVTVDDAADIDRAFDALLRLHKVRSAARGSSSAFLDSETTAFHRSALRSLTSAGWARVYLLTLSGEPIAATYVFSAGNRMSFYQSGMDPRYGRFSVGSLLIVSMIESAIIGQHTEFDFLRGNEPYKSKWTNTVRQQQVLRFFDSRLASRVAQALYLLKAGLQRSKLTLRSAVARPSGLRKVLSSNQSD